jgi:hypothetical protein
MTYSHIKFDIHFDSEKTSYYSLLEKLKNELKKAYYNCNTDDDVDTDSDTDSDNISGSDNDYEYKEVELVKQ